MLRNYLTVALRNLKRHPGYTLLNVAGLALGLACCLLILAFAYQESRYDTFHEDADAIYRVNIRAVTPQQEVQIKAGQPPPLAPALEATFDEIAHAARLTMGPAVLQAEGTASFEEGVTFTDPSFFDVFTFPLVQGNAATALTTPASIVLTEDMAEKYFGSRDVLGRRLHVSFGGAFEEFSVTGLAKNPPTNSSLRFDFLLPFERWPQFAQFNQWTSWSTNTYVRLTRPEVAATLQARLPAFTAEHYAPMINTWRILQWLSEDRDAFRLELQPLADVHFAPHVEQATTRAIDPSYPAFLLGLALAILLIACINFTTLATGRAARRAKEVGLRKTFGAVRRQLMLQFWSEAVLMSLIALVLGYVLAELLLPLFNDVTGSSLALGVFLRSELVLLLIGLVLLTGLLAGTYPALYLTRFRPITTLRQKAGGREKNRWMQGLVVVQFALSILFIIAALTVSSQLRMMQTKSPGYDEEQVVVVSLNSGDVAASERLVAVLRQELHANPEITGVTSASAGLSSGTYLGFNVFGDEGGEAHQVFLNQVDEAFVEAMGLEVIAGRTFSPEQPSDRTHAVLVNEALVRDFGWDDPLGRQLPILDTLTVVGVVKDFHFQSLHHAVAPMALYLKPADPFRYLYVRLAPGNLPTTLAALETAWQRVAPDRPFNYTFLDDALARQYREEARWQQLVSYAALFAVLVACLGLFGLAAFTAEQRKKEVGIRKVLGAGVPGLVVLLSKDFLRLVLVANLVAWPVAYLFLHEWLEGFAYRITLGPVLFLTGSLLALLIAVLTVSTQTLRTAHTDPVKALRYE